MAPGQIINDSNAAVETTSKKSESTTLSTQTSAVLHRSLHKDPLSVTRAKGNILHLADGQEIFDATGGAAVACLGHGHADINAAVAAQMARFSYAHSLFFSSEAAEKLARFMIDSTGGKMSRLFVVSSGSEAMESALKLARQYYLEKESPEIQRVNFIARRESWHGATLGALSVSGHVARRALYEPILSEHVGRVSSCNAYRGMVKGESVEEYVQKLADELDGEFQRLGPDTVCAFIAEPVVGAAMGCVPAVEGYFKAMRRVCDKYGALLILDEVMCGMGRTGTLHAWEQEGVVPDIQTLGKGLGGGYVPVAGMLINKRVVDVLDKGTGAFSHGQTYQGHPVACAAALEVQRVIQRDGLLKNVRRMGDLLSSLLVEKLSDHPNVGNIRGKGLFWGVCIFIFSHHALSLLKSPTNPTHKHKVLHQTHINDFQIEFIQSKQSKTPFPPSHLIATRIHELGLTHEYNISIYPGTGCVDGITGDHVLIAPAYNVNESEIRDVASRVVRIITEFFESPER